MSQIISQDFAGKKWHCLAIEKRVKLLFMILQAKNCYTFGMNSFFFVIVAAILLVFSSLKGVASCLEVVELLQLGWLSWRAGG